VEVAAFAVREGFEGAGGTDEDAGPDGCVEVVVRALDVRDAVLDRAEGVPDPLRGNAQLLGDAGVQLVLSDLPVGVALPAAAEDDQGAFRQLQRREAP
jgi:hypothetical protein